MLLKDVEINQRFRVNQEGTGCQASEILEKVSEGTQYLMNYVRRGFGEFGTAQYFELNQNTEVEVISY